MNKYLDSGNFPCKTDGERLLLTGLLNNMLSEDARAGILPMLGRYRKVLADNLRRAEWEGIYNRLTVLFKCGKSVALDGPMIGVTMAIRDSDYFPETEDVSGADRSALAKIEFMATCWNATFGPTGLWMGKTFEPVDKAVYCDKCGPLACPVYNAVTTRIGRNFFREPERPAFIQSLGLPVLTKMWGLKERPMTKNAAGFEGLLLPSNLEKEQAIPYLRTGGKFIAQPGRSVIPEMNGKEVYSLNYRWPKLEPAYPMTRLIDELVQIDEGVYLGQLVMATRHYSLGTLHPALLPGIKSNLGEAYDPSHPPGTAASASGEGTPEYYGYQSNGFFLMIDTARACEAYADYAFPHLRPRPGESGYKKLGYDMKSVADSATVLKIADYIGDWATGWREKKRLKSKFTSLCLEASPRADDGDVRELLRDGESVLQMLQRIQGEISEATLVDDKLEHFEKLNRLFRAGVAPGVNDGLFQGQGKGFNCRFNAPEKRNWYGTDDPCRGFDYYHGATLNLHCGFEDVSLEEAAKLSDMEVLPAALTSSIHERCAGPNLLDQVWASLGRFIFPWAGKSFETISPQKLSMLLDESGDLAERYPERVDELKRHPASRPFYDLVEKSAAGYWKKGGAFAARLKNGAWDSGMSRADRNWWQSEASSRWVFGNNIQDSRILPADPMFRALDMNYKDPLPSIQRLADSGPSPFVRQGCIFLGVADQSSVLSTNNGISKKKRVFQFHYRFPMLGGSFPIGLCLDELVELAEGLFLGQLIYSTLPFEPYHSSVDPRRYKYQLFGYFLLLDDEWERHRQAIGLDINTAEVNRQKNAAH